jgi:rod shape-determining protein MreB
MAFKKNIGIDLGTIRTRVVLADKGVVTELPTIIAIDRLSKKIIAVGEKAEEMVGKTPAEIEIIRPIKNSVLSNYRATEALLKYLINSVSGKVSFVKPNVIMNVPSVITSVEKRALEEAVYNAGAGQVYLYPSSYLSSLGADLVIERPFGNMIVNMGAGTTETAIISLNGVVVSNSSKFASGAINEALINYFRKIYGLIIGEVMAEKIKTTICSAIITDEQREMEVRGRDATTGMPRNLPIKTNDVYEAIKGVLNEIVLSIRSVLEKAPPELSSDIVDTGLVISGGGVMLDKFTQLLIKALGIPVVTSEHPTHTTALGIQKILQNFEMYEKKGRR